MTEAILLSLQGRRGVRLPRPSAKAGLLGPSQNDVLRLLPRFGLREGLFIEFCKSYSPFFPPPEKTELFIILLSL